MTNEEILKAIEMLTETCELLQKQISGHTKVLEQLVVLLDKENDE